MAPTPSPRPSSSSSSSSHQTPSRTPQSKHRLQFPNPRTPLPATKQTNTNTNSSLPTEHPVEVISRIRNHPDPKALAQPSPLEVSGDARSIRVRSDIGYRDFSLDGVSLSEAEDLQGFYAKYVASRIRRVRMGSKCTVMMYGPTGSGKSHTMFGCAQQPGIVYRALRDILGEEGSAGGSDEEDDGAAGSGMTGELFVQVAVLEIYNEDIYDLLSGNTNPGAGLPKPNSTPKVRLEVMGKKAKNATFISGNEAGKISREVAKVEKRRTVKSTNCNERSSRSHCMIILDVPSVGGRLMLVDMAGSENIDQAGQTGFEAKMQTAKINQGNIALKRVVESIANGDSHVPFRDSKLTMLLQDSFEDDKSKILMILCASPDPKELHKTISTLEYGAKAKCIVRVAHMPTPKEKMISDESSSTLLRSRIEAMNQFIYKLQMENKIKEKERDDAHKELMRKEEELVELKSKVQVIEGRGSAAALKEQEINSKVNERTQMLRLEIMKMEEKMLKQQEELGMLRQRLEEMESNRSSPRGQVLHDADGGRLMKRLSEIYAGGGDQGMEKSMELDMGDQPAVAHDVREIQEDVLNHQLLGDDEVDANVMRLPERVCLSTVFEGDDEGEDRESAEGYEVDKEVVEEEYTGNYSRRFDVQDSASDCRLGDSQNPKDSASARKTRIQNIFRLCGNYRELAQVSSRTPPKNSSSPLALGKERRDGEGGLHENFVVEQRATESPISSLLVPLASLHLDEQKSAEPQSLKRRVSSSFETSQELKENCRLAEGQQEADGTTMDVFVKWEAASKGLTGNFIKKLKVLKNSTLCELRKLIETHLEEEKKNQSFTFLLLGDPSGAPVRKENEGTVLVSKLPICSNQPNSRLACLRPMKMATQHPNHVPFGSLENIISIAGR